MTHNDTTNIDNKISYINNMKVDCNGMEYQNQIMNFDTMNHNFKLIENSLNEFYEKIRCIEDVIDYAKAYIDNEVGTTITECKCMIDEIEKMNDMMFSNMKNYTVTSVPFINSKSALMTDRDGSPLNECEIYNNSLVMSGVIKENIAINNVDILSNSKCKYRNADALINNKAYRSSYVLNGPLSDGIEEIITFVFDSPKSINTIRAKLANCTIKYIKYIYNDGTVLFDNDFNNSIPFMKNIKSIIICICCNDYKINTIEEKVNLKNKFDLNTSSI